jgi:uncharacterized OB-fold protein
MTARPTRRCSRCGRQRSRLRACGAGCRKTGSLVPADISERGVIRSGAVTTYTHNPLSTVLHETRTASLETDGRTKLGAVDIGAISDANLLGIVRARRAEHPGDLHSERAGQRVENDELARRKAVLSLLAND